MAGILETILGGTGVITAAVIAGSVAVRNARKTPHETLKSLLEIMKDENIWREDRPIVAAAVHREIQRIGILNEARLQGFWAYQRERFLGGVAPHIRRAALVAVLIPPLTILTVWLWPTELVYATPATVREANDTAWGWIAYRWSWAAPSQLVVMPGVGELSTWVFVAAMVALIAWILLLFYLAKAVVRSGAMVEGWFVFTAFLLATMSITHIAYHILGHLVLQPAAWQLGEVQARPCSVGAEPVVGLPDIGEPTTVDRTMSGTHFCYHFQILSASRIAGDSWIQIPAFALIVATSVAALALFSLLLRAPYWYRRRHAVTRIARRGVRSLFRLR